MPKIVRERRRLARVEPFVEAQRSAVVEEAAGGAAAPARAARRRAAPAAAAAAASVAAAAKSALFAATFGAAAPAEPAETPLSRGQRARREKAARLQRRAQLAADQDRLARDLARSRAAGPALGDFSALKSALEAAGSEDGRGTEATSRPPSRRQRRATAAQELQRVQAVLKDERFAADPFRALEQHIRNTTRNRAEAAS